MVTWMRVADVTVLSVGALTFSSDPRFSVIHVPRSVEKNNNIIMHDSAQISPKPKKNSSNTRITKVDWKNHTKSINNYIVCLT